MRFLNLFFNFMSQKYQNEKSPIVYGIKKPKTLRKVPKNDCVTSLRNLQDVSEHPVGSLRATEGHLGVRIGHIRVTLSHLRITHIRLT